jgi:hypothetical protein
MRRRTCLVRLNESFSRRILRLEGVAAQIAGKTGHDIERYLTFVAIESLSTWSNFVREFYLSCVLAYPKRIRGGHVSHQHAAINDERLALLRSILVLRGNGFQYQKASNAATISHRDEPTWSEKRALASLSQDLMFTNNGSIVAGLSYQTTFFDDLPTVRNFYGHRSYAAAQRVLAMGARKYGAANLNHPSELVNRPLPLKTQTLLQEWLGDIRRIGLAVCE